MTKLRKLSLLCLLLGASVGAYAGVFTSQDGQFTIDLPGGWTNASTPAAGSVLSVVKGAARIDIRPLDACSTETCIEKKVADDLLNVKRKKMQIIGNSYTGEEIKRIDFSTGEPFFYISFFTPKNDFSSGYFLINSKAYSMLSKDLSYAEADLIFSFISPVVNEDNPQRPQVLKMDLKDPRAYDIVALDEVKEVALPLPGAPAPVALAQTPGAKTTAKTSLSRLTLITKNMPPYLRHAGRWFDAFIALALLFLLAQSAGLLVRLFVRVKKDAQKVNPNSLYPIKFRRLYGTPSLIFRARDNQGNTLLSLSGRWDSLLLFGGLALIALALLLTAATGVAENAKLLPLSAFAYNSLYSACSLAIPLGMIIFFCGVIWSQLVLREFSLYDCKGKKAAFVLQKGFGFKKERYLVYFAKSKDVLILERKRFSFLRKWQIASKDQTILAHVEETQPLKALARKILGHCWGMLRASYTVKGQMDSAGEIKNACAAFNRFSANIDKPQALEARDLLVAAMIINIRDKDKWYPWW